MRRDPNGAPTTAHRPNVTAPSPTPTHTKLQADAELATNARGEQAEVESERWILFVDDERSVRRVGERALTGAGHQVLLAEDGFVAVELFERYGSRISLVILDLTMPRMSGAETLSALRAIDPCVRVVLSSGYSTEDATRSLGDQQPSGFIQKPYRVAQLLETVRTMLARPRV